jgi:hypothetical protein
MNSMHQSGRFALHEIKQDMNLSDSQLEGSGC